jgi:hypothetical protein
VSDRHRLSSLLGMHVTFRDGRDGDQVTDVRLSEGDRVGGAIGELVVAGFIVGRRRPGTLFGYDRHPSMGPWVLRRLVRFLHRRTGYLTWEDVAEIDWDTRTLRLRTDSLRPVPPT